MDEMDWKVECQILALKFIRYNASIGKREKTNLARPIDIFTEMKHWTSKRDSFGSLEE